MARGIRTPSLFSLTALFYLVLLFSPLALLKTAHAQSDQDPLQENYGTGMFNVLVLHSCLPLFRTEGQSQVGERKIGKKERKTFANISFCNSYRYWFGNHILLRRCDAEGQSRDSSQWPRTPDNTFICGLYRWWAISGRCGQESGCGEPKANNLWCQVSWDFDIFLATVSFSPRHQIWLLSRTMAHLASNG